MKDMMLPLYRAKRPGYGCQRQSQQYSQTSPVMSDIWKKTLTLYFYSSQTRNQDPYSSPKMTFGVLGIQGAGTFDFGIRFAAQDLGAAYDLVYLLSLQEEPILSYFRANVDVNWSQNIPARNDLIQAHFYPFHHSFIHSFIYSLIHLFTHSFIHSYIYPLIHLLLPHTGLRRCSFHT